jgi:hypothetical protein
LIQLLVTQQQFGPFELLGEVARWLDQSIAMLRTATGQELDVTRVLMQHVRATYSCREVNVRTGIN